jgi:hypothetical protein
MLVFEDETTITQKPCIRKSFSLEGEQQKIEHNGSSRNKFSTYISMLWPDKKLMYNFYDVMDSKNTINHLENPRKYVMKIIRWKRLILIWDNASLHISRMVHEYIKKQNNWLTIISIFQRRLRT